MDLSFENVWEFNGQIIEKLNLHVSIDSDLNVLKFDVDLGSLPPLAFGGREVTANFQIHNFDNNLTFYTDANELEMQKRIVNYRPTWNLSLNYAEENQNVTANFYPVNSAVTMKDGDRVFTVMNDRAQGASALTNGHIEFMQNRRIPADDNRGMGEYMNEVDELGHGIRVPATYYIQIFDQSKTASL